MNPAAEHVQERLLDLAYGELSADVAHAVEAHLAECPSCRTALEEIRGVRRVMAKLPQPAAPQAGLDSLLAYAEQAARRAKADVPPKRTWWRRWLVSVSALAAVVTFGIIANEVSRAPELQNPRERAIAEKLSAKADGEMAPSAAAPVEDEQRADPRFREKDHSAERGRAADRPIDRVGMERLQSSDVGPAGTRDSARLVINESRGLGSGSYSVGAPAHGTDLTGPSPRSNAGSKKKAPKKAIASPQRDSASEEDHFAPERLSDAQTAPNPKPSSRFENSAPAPLSVAQGAAKSDAKRESVHETRSKERTARSEMSAMPSAAEGKSAGPVARAEAPLPSAAEVKSAPVAPAERVPPSAAAMKPRSRIASAEPPALSTAARKPREAEVTEESEAMSPRNDSTRARADALSRKAAAAQREGSRALEAQYLREALGTGIDDRKVLTNLLLRLCDAELAVGRIKEGRAACERVAREFPGTHDAQVAIRRLEESRSGRTESAQPSK